MASSPALTLRNMPTLAVDPSTGMVAGDHYRNSVTGQARVYDGTRWANFGTFLPAGIQALGNYDQQTHTYMPIGSVPITLPAKLAGVADGTVRAKLGVAGASNVRGWDGAASQAGLKDYPLLIRNAIAAMGYTVAEGPINFMDNTAAESRASVTGAWSYNPASGAPGALIFLYSTGAASISGTFTTKTDTFRVKVNASSSPVSVKVDGVLITSFASLTRLTNSSGTLTGDGSNNEAVAIINGTPGWHTVTVSSASGTMYPMQIAGYLTTAGVEIGNYGCSGSTANDWSVPAAGGWYSLQNRLILDGLDAVLVDLGTWVNSFNAGTPVASMLADTISFVNSLKTAGIEVILVTPPPFIGVIATVATAPTTAFWQGMFTLADSTGCMLIDQWTALGGTWAIANGLGLENAFDTVHQSTRGMAAVAQNIIAALGLEPVVSQATPIRWPTPKSGTIHIPRNISTSAYVVPTRNQDTYMPFPVDVTTTYSGLCCWVGTAGTAGSGAQARLSVFADDGTGQGPGALIYDGAISLTSTGQRTVSNAIKLQPGLYWTGFSYQYTTSPATPPQVSSAANVIQLAGSSMANNNYRCMAGAGAVSAGFASNPVVAASTIQGGITGLVAA